jgi:hypothetical protein
MTNVATAALERGALARAAALLPACLAATRACGERLLLTTVLNYCGRLAWERGDAAGARRLLEESLALSRASGDRYRSGATLAALAALAVERGDRDAARALYADALANHRVSEYGPSNQAVAAVLDELGALAEDEADYLRAHALYREGLDLRTAPDAGEDADPADSLERFAGLAAARGDPVRAVRLAAAAAALRRPTVWLSYRTERIRPRRPAAGRLDAGPPAGSCRWSRRSPPRRPPPAGRRGAPRGEARPAHRAHHPLPRSPARGSRPGPRRAGAA